MANSNQANADGDSLGDVCDDDGDGGANGADNCPLIANSDQANVDGSGDACDMTDSFLVTIPVFPPPVLWLMALLIGIMGGRGAVAMRRRSI